jgi:DNA-binding IclR family transcriptional regulator
MDKGTNRTGTVKSGSRLLEIVGILQEHHGLGVSELAELLGKSRGSVHRYLKTLHNHGYVVRREEEYHLSLRFLDHGIYTQQQNELFNVAKEKVESLASKVDERAWCIVEEHDVGIFLCGAVGEHSVPTDARVGSRTPLHSTSGGKAILAHLDESRIEHIVDHIGLPAQTPQTITNEAELWEELERIRERGYALNLEESISGLHAVGAPVFDDSGVIRGALSVAGAANRLPEARCTGEVAEAVLTATNEVELALNYS